MKNNISKIWLSDDYTCFMRTEMDWLVIGDSLFEKEKQPIWDEDSEWMDDYELD